MDAQRCLHPDPGTCEYVTLHGKRDFADVNKLRILRWRDYLGLPGWAWCDHNSDFF